MKSLLGVTIVLAFSFGCSKTGTADLKKLKDEACACKDKACGEAVNKKLDEAFAKMALESGGKQPDEKTGKELISIMTEAGTCLAKLEVGRSN